MKPYPVITIGRQYGSGGKAIAQALSQRLGIPYYDSALVNRAAEKSRSRCLQQPAVLPGHEQRACSAGTPPG